MVRGPWAGPVTGTGTINAFVRRLLSSQRSLARLVRADVDADGARPAPHRRPRTRRSPSSTCTISTTAASASSSVSRCAGRSTTRSAAAWPGRCCSSCSTSSTSTRRATAIRRSRRSCSMWPSAAARMGIILIGAQQTASEVERRIIANSSIRVVGRLDAAEAARPEYGFLPTAHQRRAVIAKPGTMFVQPARDPGAARGRVPVPVVGHAAERTRRKPGRGGAALDARRPPRRRAAAGRGTEAQSCACCTPPTGTSASSCAACLGSKSTARCSAEIVEIAGRERAELVLVVGDLFESMAPPPDAIAVVWDTLLALRETGAHVVVRRRQPRPASRSSSRSRPCSAGSVSRCSGCPPGRERAVASGGRCPDRDVAVGVATMGRPLRAADRSERGRERAVLRGARRAAARMAV